MTRAGGHAEDDEVDVVVVGTGAGGAPVLAALARAGLRVVALEAGSRFEPGDHTPDETDAVDINWMDERLSGGADPTAFGANNSGRGVGGSTLHWGAFVPRPDRNDLQLRTTQGIGEDWPIPYDDLSPYLQRVERFIGVSGPAGYPWDPSRHYEFPPVPRNSSARVMAAGCDALGIRTADAPAALVSRDHHQPEGGLRQACVNCGCCHQGCRNGAKCSMDVTYLPLALAHGARIRSDSTVHGIECDSRGRVTAVLYRCGGVPGPRRHPGVGSFRTGHAQPPRVPVSVDQRRSPTPCRRRFCRGLLAAESRRHAVDLANHIDPGWWTVGTTTR